MDDLLFNTLTKFCHLAIGKIVDDLVKESEGTLTRVQVYSIIARACRSKAMIYLCNVLSKLKNDPESVQSDFKLMRENAGEEDEYEENPSIEEIISTREFEICNYMYWYFIDTNKDFGDQEFDEANFIEYLKGQPNIMLKFFE